MKFYMEIEFLFEKKKKNKKSKDLDLSCKTVLGFGYYFGKKKITM